MVNNVLIVPMFNFPVVLNFKSIMEIDVIYGLSWPMVARILGNHILNWPKLLRPFKTAFVTLYRCVCVRNVILHHFKKLD